MTIFADKTYLVTGATSGIGLAVTQALLSKDANVVALGLPDEQLKALANEANGRLLVLEADVSNSEQVNKAFADAAARFGPLSGVLNAAGILKVVPIGETTDELWQRMIQVNLTGTFHVMRAAAGALTAAGSGSIVSIASELSLVGQADYVAYTASKGGVLAMARSLAAELAPIGIRVNSLSPGTTDTPMLAAGFANDAERLRDQASVPLGRFASPEEIAAAALWLLGPESSYVTGTNLVVDGGRTGTFSLNG